jgi:glycosyltransferase involved in cell wall biosynthesis
VTALGLDDIVRFTGKLDRSLLPQLYRDHDILIFPSIWDEPFAITPLEAMASGLPVVATTTGGSSEIFKDNENSLTFPAGDGEACADAIIRLSEDMTLYDSIRQRARELVLSHFTLEHMVDRIEEDLIQTAR